MNRTQFDTPGPVETEENNNLSKSMPLADATPNQVGPFDLNCIYHRDCLEGMASLPPDSVDIAIADPPYNLSKGGDWKWDNSVSLPGFGGDWSKVMAKWDDMPLADYLVFVLAWLNELKRVVRPTGSIWIHGTYHNIGIINFALQLLEIEIINDVVWYKRNSFPNLSGRRLTASHESILWAHTGGSKREYYFAYQRSKEMGCQGDLLKKPGKQMRTVWDIPNNKSRIELRFGKHPTQKPVRLLKRMLSVSAEANQILLVPFAGAGSDCVAASELGIKFLAFETDEKYVEIGRNRVANSVADLALFEPQHSPANDPSTSRSFALRSARPTRTVPSLIKWTGSKRSQTAAISELMPRYRRYFEPFLGGGAVLYAAAAPGTVAGDIYQPLIELWTLVRDDAQSLVEDYEAKWLKLGAELDGLKGTRLTKRSGLPMYFYQVRDRFNESPNAFDLNFLMRTCVNGIVRFNDRGAFNNSFHLSRRGMQPDRFRTVVEAWHSVLQDVEFVCQDYQETVSQAAKGDLVYLDPPYAGNQQRYTENLDLDRFFSVLESLNGKDVAWILSFDGHRGDTDLSHPVPESLYKRHLLLKSGNSAVNKVLNGPLQVVQESLYLNY